MFQQKNVKKIDKLLSKDLENICNWSVENELSIYFGEDKIKLILAASQCKISIRKLYIKYQNVKIKQYSQVSCLDFVMDEIMSGEPMALKIK